MKQSEMWQNTINQIEAYSKEFGISPAFVEKDIYVVKVLDVISEINYDDVSIIFSGGTCLSKAYGKIKRFSEDIDFRLHTSKPFSRSERKAFCDFILENLSKVEDCKILEKTILKGNENKFLSFEMEYVRHFEGESLRPNIKVEFTFENIILKSENREVKSFLAEFDENYPKTNLACISPVEVSANKMSALLWRVSIKNRTKPLHSKENDPTIVRHLHDICALEKDVLNDDFVKILKLSFEDDKKRGVNDLSLSLVEFAKNIYRKFIQDKEYKKEYQNYVDSMSYSKEVEKINFEMSVESFERIIKFLEEKC